MTKSETLIEEKMLNHSNQNKPFKTQIQILHKMKTRHRKPRSYNAQIKPKAKNPNQLNEEMQNHTKQSKPIKPQIQISKPKQKTHHPKILYLRGDEPADVRHVAEQQRPTLISHRP